MKRSKTFTHAELVELARDWLIKPFSPCADYGHSGCPVVITEISADTWGKVHLKILIKS